MSLEGMFGAFAFLDFEKEKRKYEGKKQNSVTGVWELSQERHGRKTVDHG